jgi:hypothetical protein
VKPIHRISFTFREEEYAHDQKMTFIYRETALQVFSSIKLNYYIFKHKLT